MPQKAPSFRSFDPEVIEYARYLGINPLAVLLCLHPAALLSSHNYSDDSVRIEMTDCIGCLPYQSWRPVLLAHTVPYVFGVLANAPSPMRASMQSVSFTSGWKRHCRTFLRAKT